jgi:hypothetical protein
MGASLLGTSVAPFSGTNQPYDDKKSNSVSKLLVD